KFAYFLKNINFMNRLPHLDKTEEDQPGHYPYIAYKKGISSLLSRDMTVKKHRSQLDGAF
ncbi:hypothetical protein KV109_014800, partial [Bacillus amyloliquefaciens]|uniref:hypothetical protein n=1 Tax=Bacillus amyloliquefaciens TaxID=1390 RepID=UPI001CBAA81B